MVRVRGSTLHHRTHCQNGEGSDQAAECGHGEAQGQRPPAAESEGRQKQREEAAEDQRCRQGREGSLAAALSGEDQPDQAGAKQPAEEKEADEEGIEVDGVQSSLRL